MLVEGLSGGLDGGQIDRRGDRRYLSSLTGLIRQPERLLLIPTQTKGKQLRLLIRLSVLDKGKGKE
jgi:hypothetical protein